MATPEGQKGGLGGGATGMKRSRSHCLLTPELCQAGDSVFHYAISLKPPHKSTQGISIPFTEEESEAYGDLKTWPMLHTCVVETGFNLDLFGSKAHTFSPTLLDFKPFYSIPCKYSPKAD